MEYDSSEGLSAKEWRKKQQKEEYEQAKAARKEEKQKLKEEAALAKKRLKEERARDLWQSIKPGSDLQEEPESSS